MMLKMSEPITNHRVECLGHPLSQMEFPKCYFNVYHLLDFGTTLSLAYPIDVVNFDLNVVYVSIACL
jgi:hypothetical protein